MLKSACGKIMNFFRGGWTCLVWGATICALFAMWIDSAGEEVAKSAKLASAEVKVSGLDVKARAELEGELERLKSENAALAKELEAKRKELIETNFVYSRQSERLKRIELSAAAAVETLEPVYVGSREEEMAGSLRLLSEAGAKLAANVSGFCEELDATISGLPIDKVAQAKLRLGLDGLRREAGDLAVLASPPAPPAKFEKCRILDFDKSLRVAVLSAGFKDGVRNGLLLKAGPDRSVVLKVVAVRPMACAAKVVDGDPERLLPGMEAFAGAR